MSVSINHKEEVAYGLLINTDLDDLKRRNGPYFAYFLTEFDCFAGQLRHSG